MSAGWPNAKAALRATDASVDSWRAAYQLFLETRLADRYLKPIRSIRADGSYSGEGFAILTIQCALLEFLASLRLGFNYSHGASFGVDFKYGDSRKLFVDFLRKCAPFESLGLTKAHAESFYANVRCGLVHEAQTKNGWKVWAYNANKIAIDPINKIVNRDLLADLIDDYLVVYEAELYQSKDLQAAFIRKLDYIQEHSS
ncbi:hypothetical protein [Devosia sp. XK-2]|uniref:hypothetical protein n=1 Tax=Devosia sp. XK-2 TaxID=3126689 RepID=UPI0030CCF2A1